MTLTLEARPVSWPMSEPFVIARGAVSTADGIIVTLTDGEGRTGRGEAYGVNYRGETPASMLAEIEAAAPAIRAGIDRHALLGLLPKGGARCAIDAALWDLEAKATGIPAWQRAGIAEPRAMVSAYTIGIGTPERMREKAAARAGYPLLKVKVDAGNPLRRLRAVREGAPEASIILDPNASWTRAQLEGLLPDLMALGVVLIEQPLPPEADADLAGIARGIPICADESLHDADDLARIAPLFDFVNIKLDKTGGLTAGLALADAAEAAGLRLMVGCMIGSSLAMAPAAVLAQRCRFVDLDGPLLQSEDVDHPIAYHQGRMDFPSRELWG
ncbi:N-acetyl-D-Glu racemase DgcA [Sphingomonas canadensis]|uniref:Dipeptide epimerase n=1 Tax=Sphingomonas canadensis TaxID=1219257 RepID=A0ABW3H883_9SPHN|nr:N-acetyl-D-Glu racemase DgcA [Sphingomonas canadensis]MCW3836963.1 dipeptide epimerase [Sphingomonas canadensis]